MRRSSLLAVSFAIALVAAACGDDDGPAAGPISSTTPQSSPAGPVTVTAVDYDFHGLPDTVDAGTSFVLENDSAAEVHELVAMRIPDDETRSVDELLALPPDDLQQVFDGPPAAVLVAPPGEPGFAALGDGTLTEPGQYVVMCFIPTGADPTAYLDALDAAPGEPPQVPGGPPHFVSGMHHELTVR